MKTIVSKPKDDQACLNGIGKFSLLVLNNLVKVNWFQNSKKIDEKESILKFEQVTSGRIRSLIVKNCSKTDFTTYSVESNGEKFNFKLNMVDRQKYLNLEPVMVLTDLIKDEPTNGIIRNSVLVSTPSVEIQWFKNGKETSKSESVLNMEKLSHGCERILIVKNLKNNEKPDFTVKAVSTNQSGSKSVSLGQASSANSSKQNSKTPSKPVETQSKPVESPKASVQVDVNNKFDNIEMTSTIQTFAVEGKSVWTKTEGGQCRWERSYQIKEWKFNELVDNSFRAETKNTKWRFEHQKCVWLPLADQQA